MSGMDGARIAAIQHRQTGYVMIAVAILASVLTTVYQLWPIVYVAPLIIAAYALGRSQGLAESRTLQSRIPRSARAGE